MTLLVVVFDWLMSERFVAMAHTLDGMKADGNVADRREAQGGRRKTDRFGLNMRRWAAQHESYIDTALMQGEAPQRLLDWHLRKLQRLQHERLIHLIVLFITIALFLTSLAFVVLVPSTLPVSLVVYLILLVLLIFYLRHYFFLENTVQHWYHIAEELHDRAEEAR